jgi:uncharacterized protein (DUF1015 family)
VADIKPFRGLQYDPELVGDISAVITPPYDVISAEGQSRYYQINPHNMIRLDYGQERHADSPKDNRYTRAAETLADWQQKGVLKRDERPALYLVEHRFTHQGSKKSRFSLFARVRLEDLGSGDIRPHEMTMKGPSEDRLQLLRACNANLSPIMGLFRHRQGSIESVFRNSLGEPSASAVDEEGVKYSMWAITDEEAIDRARDLLADRTVYIADGHHRYATALTYRRERLAAKSSSGGNEAFNFVMMTLTPAEDPDLIMMPTHRLVRGLGHKMLSSLKDEWNIYFDKELLSPAATPTETIGSWTETLGQQHEMTFGLYGIDGNSLCLLRAKPEMMLPVQPSALGDLDVFILHQVILRQMLGIDSSEKEEECLAYTRDGLETISRVDNGEYQLAFLLNPTPIERMLAVADEGVKMPPKSTYFYPKTPSGLVINPLWDD